MSIPKMKQFKAPQTLMVQGTTSDAGKSTLVAAIGRILVNHGIKAVPFKPQNMALNSAVTVDGGEIGRAQAVQAQACGVDPITDFNPVLIKPTSDTGAQIIVNGQPFANQDAKTYHNYKPLLLEQVLNAHLRLQSQADVVVVEGAGSPAEINLRDRDIANMGFAEAVDCPVVIIADIDKGGVFAHLLGTLQCLSQSEQERVVGFVINRFRGDIDLLKPGLDWLEEKTNIPVLGVIPYLHDFHIEAEDAIANKSQPKEGAKVKIVVVALPHISNHTDFDSMALHPQIDLEFVRTAEKFEGCDLLVLPGSKAVISDLDWLEQEGWKPKLEQHLRYGGKVLGICGGMQMLGVSISDPSGIESKRHSKRGLGWLDIETTMYGEKTLKQCKGQILENPLGWPVGASIAGYEIHQGQTIRANQGATNNHLFNLNEKLDGYVSEDKQVLGSYLHGLFDDHNMLNHLLHWVKPVKANRNAYSKVNGKAKSKTNEMAADGVNQGPEFAEEHEGYKHFDYQALKESEIQRLSDAVESAIPIATWRELLSINS